MNTRLSMGWKKSLGSKQPNSSKHWTPTKLLMSGTRLATSFALSLAFSAAFFAPRNAFQTRSPIPPCTSCTPSRIKISNRPKFTPLLASENIISDDDDLVSRLGVWLAATRILDSICGKGITKDANRVIQMRLVGGMGGTPFYSLLE